MSADKSQLNSPAKIAEKLYVLTLSIECVMLAQGCEAASPMLAERTALLDDLEKFELDEAAQGWILKTQDAEARLLGHLNNWRTHLTDEAVEANRKRVANKSYQPKANNQEAWVNKAA